MADTVKFTVQDFGAKPNNNLLIAAAAGVALVGLGTAAALSSKKK